MAEPPIGAKLRKALEGKGWSYTRLIAEMRKVAGRQGKTLPTTASLMAILSRWWRWAARPTASARPPGRGRSPATTSRPRPLDRGLLQPGLGDDRIVMRTDRRTRGGPDRSPSYLGTSGSRPHAVCPGQHARGAGSRTR